MQSQIYIILLFVLLNVFSTNAFFFKSSNATKDGCNPNPCKHKAECVLDSKNPKLQGTCKCLTGYFGKVCENKDGCFSKPCKSGSCIVNKANPANFTCVCPQGRVGVKCEKVDECARNPCKNNGTCKLDANKKAVCTCQNGWISKNCDKRNCTIVEFKGKHFGKVPKLFIDKAVEPQFQQFDLAAKKCNVTVQQKRSYSVQTKSLVIPADAPFFIGRGLGFEITDENNRLLCNSVCLAKKPVPQARAKCFLDEVVKQKWVWDHNNPTVIHDGTYTTNPVLYQKLRQTAQVGCKDKSF